MDLEDKFEDKNKRLIELEKRYAEMESKYKEEIKSLKNGQQKSISEMVTQILLIRTDFFLDTRV